VPSRRTRTALYSETRRRELADAVVSARIHAGWDTTTDFIKAVGRGARAIYALENAEPTVGQTILAAVGRTLGTRLDSWTADTPRLILEGNPPPPLGSAPPSAAPDAIPPGWTDEEEQLWKVARHVLPGLLGMPPEKPLTRQRFRWVKDEVEKLIAAERAAGVVTPSDYS
jgi:hypothetical protein